MTAQANNNSAVVPILMASVVCAAVSNTIVRRIALVPLKHYPYLLTQMQGLIYALVYGSILFHRYRDGAVTVEMLRISKRPFLWIGFWDSLGDILGNIGTSHLPGYQTPLLAKLNIIFTAVFSNWILKRTYSLSQVGAMAVVLCGSVVSILPSVLGRILVVEGGDGESASTTSSLFYVGVYVASVAPTALAFVLKEEIFECHRHLNLDIFVVNTYGSVVSLAFTILLLPLASVPGIGEVPLRELAAYTRNGLDCFMGNDPTPADDCTGSPLAPLLYFCINVTYNIFILALVKQGGALLTFLTNTVTFPLSTILFTLPWPLLGASTLNRFVILGLAIELSGIVYYQHASSKSARPEESSSTTTNATTGKSAERTYLLTEDQGRSQYDTTLKPDPSALST